ncbi:glycosyltransferase [Mucilaginibacter dorajii]|uniref:Glycosyltransferase 2-like domain-containing protein n=1 Tax=Mucilaginibacter dorajii TaxID=692994 RepID=A0ABP7Q6Q1_9SPHI|nr:glycosyltransferase [Mucilaginibacter dorajii]MCS3737839.1 glycosyltransferase involved in cell wall biosynthesis [Mucilaginibacter dorajii]
MEDKLVSIALCTYNGQKYLREQLDSIIGQTYKNLEIVIVDDRSTDDTILIAHEYAAKDSRIKCIENETTLGFNKNFEKALSVTSGAYIAISDQDDIWDPQKIQILLENIGDSWLVFCNSVYINADGTPTDKKLLSNFSLIGKNYKALILNNYITGHNTLFIRDFLTYILPFPVIGFYDWWMGFIAFYHQRLTYVDQVLTLYREHPDAVTNTFNFDKVKRGNRFFKMMLNQLNVLIKYPNLSKEDSAYIIKLNNAFKLKLNKTSLPLFKIVARDYDELFSFVKARKNISKINFAYRFSKKQKSFEE